MWHAYNNAVDGIEDVTVVDVDIANRTPFHFVVQIPDRVFHQPRAAGIGVGAPYSPNHLQPAFSPWYTPLLVTEQAARAEIVTDFAVQLGQRAAGAVADGAARTGGFGRDGRTGAVSRPARPGPCCTVRSRVLRRCRPRPCGVMMPLLILRWRPP